MTEHENNEREEVFSRPVRAGRRTYFFDVKATRGNDYYLTITESKKRFGKPGEKPFYEKHKIFLYREDFEKFAEGFKESVDFINSKPAPEPRPQNTSEESNEGDAVKSRFTDVDYDDLGKSEPNP